MDRFAYTLYNEIFFAGAHFRYLARERSEEMFAVIIFMFKRLETTPPRA